MKGRKTLKEREKLKSDIESLLLRGFSSINQIAQIVSAGSDSRIDRSTVKRYIQSIRKNWAEIADPAEQRSAIGENIEKFKKIEREAWIIFQDNESDAIKLNALNIVMSCARNQMSLLGIDNESIKIIQNNIQIQQNVITDKTKEDRIGRYREMYQEAKQIEDAVVVDVEED